MKKKQQRKYSLSKRIVGLTVFLDSLFLVIFVVVGMIVFSVNSNQLKEKNALSESSAILNSTEHLFNGIQYDIDALSLSSDIIAYMEYVNDGNDPIINQTDSEYAKYEKAMLLLNNTIQHQDDQAYASIFLITDQMCYGSMGCLIDQESNVYNEDDGWVLSERIWYDEIQNNDSVLSKPFLQASNNTDVITYIHKIYNLDDELVGYVGAAVELDYIASHIQDFMQTDNNEVIVLSENNDNRSLVYFSDDNYKSYLYQDINQFEQIDENLGFGDQGLNKIIFSNTEGINTIDAFDKNYYMTYNEIEQFNLQVIVMVYDSQVISYELLLIIVLAIVGVLLALVGYIQNKSINKSLQPIHDIIHSIEEIKNGNYQIKVNVSENNEIKDIASAINLMSGEIDRQLKLIYDNFAYDQLTGLKNKSAVAKELNQTLFKGDKKAAVCLLQVDNLKDIIIIKGQMMGDSLIKVIADEIDRLIGKDEMLFSNGGNELVYIIPDVKNLSVVRDKVNRIIQRFKDPIVVNNIKIEIKMYAGIATYPNDDYNLEDLIKKCDVAIYKDKSSEKKQVIFYNDRISQEIAYQAEVSEQLVQALENKEIFLKYQPLIDIKSEIYGFEALARWSSPVLGDISPDVFISNAEENYLIIPIGTWILEEACKMQVLLREKFKKEFVISVNVSLIQILQNDYVDIVKRVIKETDINPEYLTLELTESIFIKSTIALDGKIEELHDLGIKFSMDDFGTGYASLTYLRNIAFDNLKIDKSFIDGILSAKKENRIVATIVSLVHNLDMKVIAEGVEQKSQYEYLRQISTDVYQGYLMSKPLTLEETIDFVEQFYKVARSKRVDVLASKKD
jgi:diguanylate cyclase (GGDEF)-like protein